MPDHRVIIVGTDGSETSIRAVEKAAGLAAESNARLVVASAYQADHITPPGLPTPTSPATSATGRRAMRRSTTCCATRRHGPGKPAHRTSKSEPSRVRPPTRWWHSPRISTPTCWWWAASG
ncbi:universal stress protein [Mycolicibacterium sp. SCSIO 43805]|uniref:universal stress protein n=1 Tax=Mycolicibacterium sp. SCSIO 43805 TaxID=3378074 RepID=UPI003AB60CD8